jgi:primosomal protein N' (replication factor Y)
MDQTKRSYYDVAVLLNLPRTYTYSCNSPLEIGQIVTVDFRGKEIIGVITGSGSTEFPGKIKNVKYVLPYKINNKHVEFAKFFSSYNLITLGSVFKLLIPFSLDFILAPQKVLKPLQENQGADFELNAEQSEACENIKKYANKYKTILMHGVTGSGKTEVFLKFIRRCVTSGQVLVMVPEIALSGELAQKISSTCDSDVFVWHNSIATSKKVSIWKKAIDGDNMIIVGARSSLFIPFSNLSAIIVDEEHDNSFKQSDPPIYNARDMAIYLGYCFDIPVILSSATPSVESYNNAISGKYEYVKLNSRYYNDAALPQVYVDDLRKKKTDGVLSEFSIGAITKCLNNKKQALVFVNRRGHTPRIFCKSCGWKVSCPCCSTWLCFHRRTRELICHCCGHISNVVNKCPICGEKNLTGVGSGIEKVYEECSALFPEARILTMSSDTIGTPSKISKAIKLIQNLEVDIILGTQIIAKGHNFDSLDLVVVTYADAIAYADDFRSIERSFQMINQVSGRAGRKDGKDAMVVIQTYDPNESMIKIFKDGDVDRFYEIELKNRKMMSMPPFGKIANITISSLSESSTLSFAKEIAKAAPKIDGVKIIGPIEPVFYKMRSRYRMRITILSNLSIQNYITSWLGNYKIPRDIRISIDVDPYDFL